MVMVKAFISYSHSDISALNRLHAHLSQLRRDGIISAWSDNEIPAGGLIDKHINQELEASGLFIALVSPDYLASNYCYEKEFERAVQLQQEGKLTIVPVIIEPCDWLSTPFNRFKALPRDGKPISTWENKNTAFLDTIQNIRKLLVEPASAIPSVSTPSIAASRPSRNYKVQKDFDSIEKMEFAEKAFLQIKELLRRYIEEIKLLENIKARVLLDDDVKFECILVNRNKVATEAQLKVSTINNNSKFYVDPTERQINYSIAQNATTESGVFLLGSDEYQLFWVEQNHFFTQQGSKVFEPQEMADTMWEKWLRSVGIF